MCLDWNYFKTRKQYDERFVEVKLFSPEQILLNLKEIYLKKNYENSE